ncbi:hypothetical protein SAMN05444392_101470 [Seinonella peptonophila]|uniref:Uncharacterized protein n=1 Tax=Seinonella peptonophila TaxID=112248 RepID=A0A1M4THJ0_9BACL|nr:hypothetical protein [Seinonella peptonophila]SHE43930.1 hypothetical protein SAMN05444392_101470 [Seinonella peptonophila]
MNEKNSYIVRISCRKCGEHFQLKGRMRKGKIETGFKRCLCDNDHDFEIRNELIT